ncbi:MAG: hypothetical protein BRC29_03450 [Nanohaloarchaea archaeon SW_7_43_1]|nr:MAG: hypothetical protein BRC29_03450 [Nanohaloarchaea archaeon SW_7_43_1]
MRRITHYATLPGRKAIGAVKAPFKKREKKSYPAEAWIVKPFKNDVDIEKDRARRLDEKAESSDIVSQESRFELQGGGTTQPVPYKQIYDTDDGALVILLSPEKGTYLPADFTLQDFTSVLEDPKKKLEEIKEQLPEGTELGIKEDEFQEKINELEDLEPLQAQLDVALDNQEWLRWGKNTVMDLKLSWEQDEGWWKRNAEKVILALAAMMNLGGAIAIYMGMNNLGEAVTEANKNLIPVLGLQFRNKLDLRR